MKKRDFLKAGIVAGAAAGISGPLGTPALAMGSDDKSKHKTGFLLLHGSWHGAWAWTEVARHLNQAGYPTIAIDFPGHGLDAILPQSFTTRPLDAAAFASEPSSIAAFGIADYEEAVLDAAKQARAAGIRNLIAVGHSMAGVPLTFAAAKRPKLFAGLVYLAALLPTKGKPAGAYLGLPDQAENSKLGAAIAADPAVIGALRIDPRSQDEAYRAALKDGLAADVDEKLFGAVAHLLTPDAPVSIYGEVASLGKGYGRLPKRFIRATHDKTVLASTAQAIVDDVNANWPNQTCHMIDIAASHEVMFAQAKLLSNLLLEAAKAPK